MKSDLAILGGKKSILQKPPHFVWPVIDKNIEKVVIKQLKQSISIYDRSGIFKEFEDAFAKMHGVKHALLCSSGTLAIHSMFIAADFKESDEVICPAYTFFATVSPLLFTGAKPVLCDCDENGNIDPDEIVKKITQKTKAVIVTHMWGIPCQMDRISEICKKNNLLLLEDCSHAHGAYYNGKIVGSFGDMAAWSLQGQKNVTGGEGGIFLTNNGDFYSKALLLGHYNKRCRQEISKESPLYRYTVTGMGLKYRAHPLAIAIAYENLKRMDGYYKVKKNFAEKIMNEFSSEKGLKTPVFDKKTIPSWYGFIFQYKGEELDNLPIEKFFAALQAEGLSEADRPGSTLPLNLLPLFQTPKELFPVYGNNGFSYNPGDFPKAESFSKNAIKFPVWVNKRDEKILNKYIFAIKKVLRNYKELL